MSGFIGWLTRFVGLLALFAGDLGVGTVASAQSTPLKVGYYRGALLSLPDYVAAEEQIYSRNGLAVELINFASGPEQISAVASGGIDVLSHSASAIMTVNAKGLDLVGIVNNQAAPIFTLLAQKDAVRPNKDKPYPANIADLKGRTIGVTARGSDVEMVVRFFLKDAGLDPDRDVTWIALGGMPTAIAAFRAKRVDYLMAFEPAQSVLVDVGQAADVVVDQRKGQGNPLFANFTSNMAAVRRARADQTPDAFKRFAKARSETLAFMADGKNFPRVIEIFQKYSALEKDTLSIMVRNNASSFSPKFDCTAIDNVVKFNVASGLLPTDKAPSCKDFVWSGAAEYLKK